MEIVEVGAVIATTTREIVAQLQSFVKPHLNPKLIDFCKQLTGVEQLEVNNTPPFLIAMHKLQQFIEAEQPLLFWGELGQLGQKANFA